MPNVSANDTKFDIYKKLGRNSQNILGIIRDSYFNFSSIKNDIPVAKLKQSHDYEIIYIFLYYFKLPKYLTLNEDEFHVKLSSSG